MAKRLPTRTEVLEVLSGQDRPLHSREIATRLGVDDVDYLGFQRLLDDLSFQGVLAARPGQRFKLSTKSEGDRGREREGIFTLNPRGFGFVASLGQVGDDVFISPDGIGSAMHGDKVVVAVRARGARGAEGDIIKIISRGLTRIAGVLRRKRGSAWVEPDDNRIRGPVTLTDEMDAKGPEGNSGSDGDAVIVAITRYPEFPGETPQGKLEAVLGKPGELRVEIAKILLLEKVEELHSDAAFNEAEAFGQTVPEDMKEGREDLTELPLPTIDPEDARDHDDAVWVERTAHGGYRAWIAIADVSSYVTPGSAIDAEAKKRGCSVYLPDRAIPMLPRPLSSNLCSLLPDVERLCLVAEVELDASGTVIESRLLRGVMKSQAKLTYGGVARALGFTELPEREPAADAMKDGLKVAYELSRLLRVKRMKRGALDFDLPEAKVVIDEATGQPTDVQRRSQDPGMKKAYQLIEELMLLANETVAKWMVDRQIPTIFRVHAPPDETKLERFATMCETLGIAFDMEATKDPKLLSALLKSFADNPLVNVLNSLLLRSMKQATYDVSNIGHFGLASKAYLHFTSPIRRYPDLVVHRQVHRVLLGEAIARDGKSIAELAEAALESSTAERRSMEVERAVVDLYRAVLMRDRIGEELEGTVTAVVGSGVFVALDAPFVDVLVRLEDLGSDRYEIDEDGLRVVAARSGDSIALGDRMRLAIIDVSILRRSVYGRRISAESDGVAPRGTHRFDGKSAKSARDGKGAKRPDHAVKRDITKKARVFGGAGKQGKGGRGGGKGGKKGKRR